MSASVARRCSRHVGFRQGKDSVVHVAVSGELGSGKSAVTKGLSARLGADVVSTGAIHRRIAAERGESALETNLVAEQDTSIDGLIDGELVRLGAGLDQIIFDSRMAWYFVPGALKVHLIVDPRVAAARMAGREATSVEGYDSASEAQTKAEQRHASELRRFQSSYDVNIDRLRNYDVVIDTSVSGVDELADLVAAFVAAPDDIPAAPHLVLSAARLATDDCGPGPGPGPGTGVETGVEATPEALQALVEGGAPHLRVAYDRPDLAIVAGHHVVTVACARNHDLVPAILVAEGAEDVTPGTTAAALVHGA